MSAAPSSGCPLGAAAEGLMDRPAQGTSASHLPADADTGIDRDALPRHKAANWVGPGRGRKSTRPGASGVVALSPFEFLDRLANLLPPPRKHRHRYHGVFAPNHKLRRAVTAVAFGNVVDVPLTGRSFVEPAIHCSTSARFPRACGESARRQPATSGSLPSAAACPFVRIRFGMPQSLVRFRSSP